jgi:FkbH-like protein
MKLIEALNIGRAMQHRKGGALRCFLAAGFNALHLKTFLAAELGLVFAELKIEVIDGLYGDLLGNIDRLAQGGCEVGIVLVEWPDLDPRLGVRNTARWGTNELDDILTTAKSRALQIQSAIEEISQGAPLVVCFPTLPLPPFFFTPGWQASSFEVELRSIAHSLSAAVARCNQVRIVNVQRLDLESPLKDRHDIESESLSGFPYRLSHASTIAGLLARLAQRPAPKKGLITDLDESVWSGILGEDGVDGISWDLEHHSQMHAFYQRFLGALISEGVMVGVASKNDPALVAEGLRRSDLAVSAAEIFPVEANWKPKSQSVARILEAWNVGAESVVFVDDSPLELAEVKATYPEMECLQFPTKDSVAIYELTVRLRDLFGKSAISEEDSIRIESIRRSQSSVEMQKLSGLPGFLEQAEAEVSFAFSKAPVDPRALDLINKTNQFNLNGNRYTESGWRKFLDDPASFLVIASYRDKFGPLGKIAVIAGVLKGRKLAINSWVMSCRAFSRQIEHRCLAELAVRFQFEEIEFEYRPTERNGPLREFFSETFKMSPSPNCAISREDLELCLGFVMKPQEVSNG